MGEGTTKIIVKNTHSEYVPLTIDNQLKVALDVAKDRVKNDWDYVGIICGLSGCLTLDTKIYTDKGIKELKKVIDKKIIISSYNFKKKRIEKAEAIVFLSGKKQIYEITTSDGRKVKASEDHVFFVQIKQEIIEKRLKELEEGDELICE